MPNYIDDSGKNNWLSKFNEKILPEVSKISIFNNNRKVLNFFVFRLRPNVEVKGMISRLILEMRCSLHLVKID